MKSQMPMGEKVEKADIILDNSSDLSQLEIQVKNMIHKIRPSTFTWLLEYTGPPVAIGLLSVLVRQYGSSVLQAMSDSIASLK